MAARLPMDIHSHSEHSVDGSIPVDQMCEAALGMGVSVYAITDHYDISYGQEDFSRLDEDLENSIRDILSAKKRFQPGLTLLTGIELGQPIACPEKSEEILGKYPFDFVLGSLHNPPGGMDLYEYDPDNVNHRLDHELETYFIYLLEMIRWGGFDSAAHLTYPFRYVLQHHPDYPFGRWDDYLEAAVKLLAEKGLGLELNTSGVTRQPPHTLPDARWVKRFREFGGEKLTLGADAHRPQRVGSGIPEGVRIACDAGFSYLCWFAGRKPQYLKLSKED